MEEEKNEDSQLTTAELIWCLVIGSLLGVSLGLYLASILWHIYVKITINIVARGKGREGADYIKPVLFDNKHDAEKYIESVNDLESKYWTYAEIVDNKEEIEPWYGHF